MPCIETGFDHALQHWWYRIVGTGLADRGYMSERDAYECAVYRYWDDRPGTIGLFLETKDPDLRRIDNG